MPKPITCKLCDRVIEEYGEWDFEEAPVWGFPFCIRCLKKLQEALNGLPTKERE
jgi:hypothetical protein